MAFRYLYHQLPDATIVCLSVKPKHREKLANLINVTQEFVSRDIEGDVWIVSAMAQRASAQAKIDSSIECANDFVTTLPYLNVIRNWQSRHET
jgi:hypothetical protein